VAIRYLTTVFIFCLVGFALGLDVKVVKFWLVFEIHVG